MAGAGSRPGASTARRRSGASSPRSSRSAPPSASARAAGPAAIAPSVHTRELLQEVGGFVYDSDAFNDDLPYYTHVNGERWLIIPYSVAYNDARFVVPQGHSGPE